MTAEQFRAALEALGWTHEDAARILRVANRQRVGEWARGARAVPPYIAAHVETLLTAREQTMTNQTLTIPEDRLDDVAPEVRRALEDGAYLDDATLKELRRVGQYEANPLEYFGRIGTSGWYLDEDGHSHYVQS